MICLHILCFFFSIMNHRYTDDGALLLSAEGLPVTRDVPFKKILLRKCQTVHEASNAATAAGGSQKVATMQFIGALFQRDMVSEKIIHLGCIQPLLSDLPARSAEEIEGLCALLTAIGHQLDHDQAQMFMTNYFTRLGLLLEPQAQLPSRLRFIVQDVIELRQRKWAPKATAMATAAPTKAAPTKAAAPDASRDASPAVKPLDNPKSKLLEWMGSIYRTPGSPPPSALRFDVTPDADSGFQCTLHLAAPTVSPRQFIGFGRTKKLAEQNAAASALAQLPDLTAATVTAAGQSRSRSRGSSTASPPPPAGSEPPKSRSRSRGSNSASPPPRTGSEDGAFFNSKAGGGTTRNAKLPAADGSVGFTYPRTS
jgi:hypothetical protein